MTKPVNFVNAIGRFNVHIDSADCRLDKLLKIRSGWELQICVWASYLFTLGI